MDSSSSPTLAFLDTETTHLDPRRGEIVEIGIIIIKENRILKLVDHKVKPEHLETAHPRALEVNGYKEQDWITAISKKECAELIAECLSDSQTVLVGHNISFDIRFLTALMIEQDVRLDVPSIPFICTKDLAKTVFKNHPHVNRFRLDDMRDHFGWSKEGAHTALKDTADCCKLFYKCISTPCPLDKIATETGKSWKDRIEFT